MKKIFLAALVAASTLATAQVNFIKTTDLRELFKAAKKENKLIFIDAYTDWCGWCKVLDKEVFTTRPITDTMNMYFIATKLEMEQDSIGIMLTRKYGTASYPTALILNGDGHLVAVIEGYSEAKVYVKYLSDAANPAKQIKERGFSNAFNIKYPSFYLDAIPMKGGKKKMADSITVNKYLASQKDLSLEQNWVVLKKFSYKFSDATYNRVLNEEAAFRKKFGDAEFERFAQVMISTRLSACTRNRDFGCLEKNLATLEQVTKDGHKSRTYYIENYYSKNKLWPELSGYMKEKLNDREYMENHGHLNELAWTIYENSDDKETLELAASWMTNVVKLDPLYMYLDTYAALLYKTGRLAEAREYAEQAIKAGKDSGEDVSATEELLNKIKQ